MDVDREQLQKLREQIGRKAHLTSMLDNLYVQEKEQKEKVEELRQEKEDEQKDVDRLEDRGLTALFLQSHRKNRREDDKGTEGSLCSLREVRSRESGIKGHSVSYPYICQGTGLSEGMRSNLQ